MDRLLQSGFLIGGIVLLIVLETCLLWLRWRQRQQGTPPLRFIPNLLAGVFLMTGIQIAIWDVPVGALLLCLSAAGLCHLLEFKGYWRDA